MTASLALWMWPSDGQDSAGNPDGGHGLHETVLSPVARGGLHATGSAGGDDNDDIEIQGASRARSQSPYDAAVHTMQDDDVPSSRQVRGEPALGGGVGVGAWAPQDGGTRVRSVTALEGAADEDVDTGGRGAIEGGSDTGRALLRPASQTDSGGVDDVPHPGSQGAADQQAAATAARTGMALDSVTDMADAGAVARSRVSALGSGQRTTDNSGKGTRVPSSREQAGQRLDPDYLRRRQAKKRAKQRAKRI